MAAPTMYSGLRPLSSDRMDSVSRRRDGAGNEFRYLDIQLLLYTDRVEENSIRRPIYKCGT